MAAKKKPLDVVPVTPAAGAVTIVGLALPPERAAGRIVGEGAAAVPELMRLLTTEAKAI
jgi:electron transfer flavoprotein beta subunit